MLKKPDLSDEKIIGCLRDNYDIVAVQIDFLPLGADRNTAVYRAITVDADYFVKLRRGDFNQNTVLVPRLLHDQGIAQVIAPLFNKRGHLWTTLDSFHVILYPFIKGESGWERDLSAQNWIELGQALKRIHTVTLPTTIQSVQRETFSSFWRSQVREFQSYVETASIDDPVSVELGAFMREKKQEISALVFHADRLAAVLQGQNLPFALCHADIHVGNVLITPTGMLYVVDWDTMILAPKERDLMFMGSGIGSQATLTADQQAAFFYQGYGQVETDSAAIAYYRCERIVQDAYEYCDQILLTSGENADRTEGLRQFKSQFEPNGVVDRALRSVTNTPH